MLTVESMGCRMLLGDDVEEEFVEGGRLLALCSALIKPGRDEGLVFFELDDDDDDVV
jgi:hypothetical protein